MILLLYTIILFSFSIYSYALIDPNLTLINNSTWVTFRNVMVNLGYYHRDTSWSVYLGLVIFLFVFHFIFMKYSAKYNALKIALLISIFLLFSYPFLSHDFFNYIFDAKIITVYHQNPYIHKALDYPADHWIRFMQWTHRTYPYGPTWLLITLIPSFLSFGKFILNFILFKLMFTFFYLMAVYYLNKMNKKWALFFATNPLIIIEGLISSHNDLVAVSIAIVGIYYLLQNKKYGSRLLLLLSGGIKYITLPFLFLHKSDSGQARMTSFWGPKGHQNLLVFISLVSLLLYLTFSSEIQPWYFLALFALLPYYEKIILKLNILCAGLLLSYYPYIRLGGWDSANKVYLKHEIIAFFLLCSLLRITFFHERTAPSA